MLLINGTIPCVERSFRGFGAPQAHAIQEHIMNHAAMVLGIAPHELREMNLNRCGDPLLVGCHLSDGKGESIIRKLWGQMMTSSDYAAKRREVDAFNGQHKTVKRGIAILPLKNAVNNEVDFMNQVRCCFSVEGGGL